MQKFTSAMALCASLMLTPCAAAAPEPQQVQTNSAQTSRDFETYSPKVTAIRINESDAPDIDGDLSDPSWARAAVIEEFYQVDPIEGAAPSQPTRALIMYDAKHLYIGIYAYDSEPDKIRRSQMQRDPRIEDDDGLRVQIDTFGSFRDSYFFALNPNGAKVDSLIENNTSARAEWNTIWRGKAQVVEDGWIAEFAIPFQSISFDASLNEWNLQIVRTIRRNNEEIRWANIDRNRIRIDMTNPGKLAGIDDIKSGIGLEVQAFAAGTASHDWQSDETDFEFNPSGNVFYKLTPSLTASLTVNTDFSDTGLDERQVNTGRFSLFFPETRDFFLQDAAVFEFGGRIFSNGPTNGLPFFSRNIGIVNGRPVDIVAGAKLSGKAGPANVGLIAVRTAAADEIGVDGQNLSAARISMPVLSESKVGIVFTNGDPTGDTNNTVAGADFQYKKSNVLNGGTFTADFAYMQSFGEGDSGHMAASHIAYRSPTWNGNFRLRDIGEDYAPKLGFVNRTNIRRYDFNAWRSFRPNKPWLRYVEVGVYNDIVTSRNGERLDNYYGGWAFAQNEPGDVLHTEYTHQYEYIDTAFNIAGEVPVPAGEYRSDLFMVRGETTSSRPLGAEARVRWGTNFGGDFLEIESGLNLRPSRNVELSVGHHYIDFDLPMGAIGIHIASIDGTIAFSPDMTIKTEIQYDNISEAFTFFSRFSWEPIPEREIFLSFGHTALIDRVDFPRDFTSLGSSLSLRLGHTFRL